MHIVTLTGQRIKSVTGVCVVLAGGLISWMVKKQPVVALSTAEAELIAASSCGKDILFFRSLTDQTIGAKQEREAAGQTIGAKQEREAASSIFVDNNSAIALIMNGIVHRNTRHIAVRYLHLRQCQEEGVVDVQRVSSKENIADMLTKSLPRQELQRLTSVVFTTKSLRE